MVLHRDVLVLYVTAFVEALTDRFAEGSVEWPGLDEADDREAGLRRARRLRPCGRRAAEQGDEPAAFHRPMPPVLPTERLAHLSYGRRRCANPGYDRLEIQRGFSGATCRSHG